VLISFGMSPWDEDRKLATEIAQGNEQAAEIFDRRYRSELESLARLKGLSDEDAKDAAQETIIGAVTLIRRGHFRGDSSLRTLLFSIVRRKIADHLRKRLPVNAMTLTGPLGGEPSTIAGSAEIAAPFVEPDIRLITEEALRSLPEGHRLILLMNQMGGYTIEEISSIIRKPRGTVGRILAEAKEIFRQKLL
jgi:RNA polymerase sigma-70 factor (ECF subfamily)